MTDYKADLNQRYWGYQKSHFPDWQKYFERPYAQNGRPPVFTKCQAWRNVIINPNANLKEIDKLLDLVPCRERHQWFRSMNSSQALAQSVLGNLFIHGCFEYLSYLKDDDELDLFGTAKVSSDNFMMEHKIEHLGEQPPHQTSLDGYISGEYQIAIECKFIEEKVGPCSHPLLKSKAENYEADFCNGNYSVQRARKARCPLTEKERLYWQYLPKLFTWGNSSDISPCPLNKNYQLVRNILAVGVKPDGNVSPNNGHVILIYDKRNPAFQNNGNGLIAYMEVQKALQEPTMLRKCSWQRIVQHIREKNILPWLIENLTLKYGL